MLTIARVVVDLDTSPICGRFDAPLGKSCDCCERIDTEGGGNRSAIRDDQALMDIGVVALQHTPVRIRGSSASCPVTADARAANWMDCDFLLS
jgi:hypothetical protein